MTLWVSSATTPYGNEFGTVAAVAETREDALRKIRHHLEEIGEQGYVPAEQYRRNLIESLESTLTKVTKEVIVDWTPSESRRR